jgi:Kef-type K+ transport system membrane component KefB
MSNSAMGQSVVEVVTRVPAILLLAWQTGQIFARYRLPKISGYLITGVVSGQHVLGLLTKLVGCRFQPRQC